MQCVTGVLAMPIHVGIVVASARHSGNDRDEGISGSLRQKRPGLDALLKGVARREFDIVAAWSVCRRGRRVQSAGDVPSTVCFVIEI